MKEYLSVWSKSNHHFFNSHRNDADITNMAYDLVELLRDREFMFKELRKYKRKSGEKFEYIFDELIVSVTLLKEKK